MLEHISWEEDSLTVVFPAHKGDPEGNDASPKHVYANPVHPHVCPVLALAVLVFSDGFHGRNEASFLFGKQEAALNIFTKWLKATCEVHEDDLLQMGIAIADIGTHSFRKGASTYLSGFVAGPSVVAIYLRARYVHIADFLFC